MPFHVITDNIGNINIVYGRANVGPDETILRSYSAYGLAHACASALDPVSFP